MENIKTSFLGLLVGFINGFFGAAGGLLLVIFLQKGLNIESYKSHGTSIAIMLPISIVSAFIYFNNVSTDFNMLFFICIGGTLGGYLGAKYLKKVKVKYLHKIFGIFMIIASIRMII